MSRVVVTGAAGFIGGVTVFKLLDAGHSVHAIDRELPSKLLLKESGARWLTGDFSGETALESIRIFRPDAVIHCAGTSLVGPSMQYPQEYYNNNFVKTKILLDYIVNCNIKTRFIFSSSASVYGTPSGLLPCQENDLGRPISPYGESKLMVDMLLQSYQRAYGLDCVSFRYFNACGADSQRRHGQAPGATHIIARLLESVRDNQEFILYGNDYNTPDGTCIRDYVHVDDLARAHILATSADIPGGIYNLGTGQGHSNLDIIRVASQVLQRELPYQLGARRPGDPDRLTADASKFTAVSGWKPQHSLADTISHAWSWYTQ